MAINFNVNPYYDDYNEDKGFHRILFKPSVSVQARELTQLQSILQKQVERMGKHFFEDGAMVIPGQIAIDTNVKAVKLTTASVGGRVLENDFASGNTIVTGSTTGVEATVLLGVSAEGDDPPTLIVRFTKTGTDNTTKEFGSTETITCTISGTPVTFITAATTPVTNSSIASIQEGVYFVSQHFVKVLAQKIVLDKFTSTPTYRVGLAVSESIVTYIDDTSLVDNSIGSPNEAAPGADRYKIALNVSKLAITSSLDQDFIELARVVNGTITKSVNRTEYSVLEKTLARRTFDESGNYTVSPFRIQVREYRNNNRGEWVAGANVLLGDVVSYNGNTYVATSEGKTEAPEPTHTLGAVSSGTVTWLYTEYPKYNNGVYTSAVSNSLLAEKALEAKLAVGIEPGKAYVQGYEIEKVSTDYVPVNKARDFATSPSDTFDTTIGNYVVVSNVYLNVTSVNVDSSSSVTFYDRFGTDGSVVGSARIRGIYYDTGNASLTNATFKLSLFDVSMNADKSFARTVKHINTSGFSANIQGFNSDYVLLTGTANASSSTTINGSGSSFTDELVAGDYVYFDSPAEGVRRVTAVTNDYTITVDSAATITNSKIYRVQTSLKEPEFTPALTFLPYSGTKSTNLTSFVYARTFEATSDGSGVVTLNPGGGLFPAGTSVTDLTIFNRTTGRTQRGALTTLTSDSATLTISALAASNSFSIVAPFEASSLSPATKTATVASLSITNPTIYSSKEISLNKTDVFQIVGVKQETAAGNVEISEWFQFDDGQRSTHYDVSKLIRKPEYPAPAGNVTVVYRFFAHSAGEYFSPFSYTDIPYEKIPVFSGDNITVRLADVLDFRPVKNDTGVGFKTRYLPHRSFNPEGTFDYYLSRKDKISIDLNGNVFVTQGAPAIIPQDPNDPTQGMNLYKVNLQPYTMSTKTPDVRFDFIDNKRFTMQDIANLEKRIQNVEYFTALSLLEQDTASLSIRDSFGLERFKNGFIVDNFEGHGVGDVFSSDYRCSVDMENNILRTQYTIDNVNLIEKADTNALRDAAAYQLTGDLVTLKYNHATLVDQPYASRVENVNPFAIATFRGDIQITPASDEWFETETRPDVVVNDNGNFDAVVTALESSGALTTVWNAWQTQWTGTPVAAGDVRSETAVLQSGIGTDFDQRFGVGALTEWAVRDQVGVRTVSTQTFATQFGEARTGVRTSVVSRIDRRVIDDRVVSSATIPFIRSRAISILGRGLKPNTRLYTFFDEVNVSSFVQPAALLSYTAVSGTFDFKDNNENYGEEAARAPRRINGNPEPAFNKGDIVFEGSTVTTATATGVVAYVDAQSSPKILHIVNVKGTFTPSATITGYPSGATGTVGTLTQPTNVITNAYGDFAAVFTIPNTPALRFRTGTRELRISDDATNVSGLMTTSGTVSYSATGTLETKQTTILATRRAEVVREAVSETRTITQSGERIVGDTGWYDPLAQTFLIDQKGGCFLTKIDLFFSTKDPVLPVTLEIRTTVNGYPGQRVLPFSRVTLEANQVNTSANGATATTFAFRSPVYVQEGSEYCIVLLSDSFNYRVWISQLGEDLIGTDRKISQQPYAGVLFKSQNASTWTADQLQDLKFKLYRAQFDTANIGKLTFTNETVPSRLLPSNPIKLVNASPVITILHPSHGMTAGANITLSGFNDVGNVKTGDLNKTHSISNVLLDSYTIMSANGANVSTLVGSSNIRVTEDIVFDVLEPIVQFQNFFATTTSFTANVSDASVLSVKSSPVGIVPNENNYFNSPKAIKSVPNEALTSGVGRKSLEITAAMTSSLDNLSPVIDLGRASVVAISNRIDNINATNSNFNHSNVTIIAANTQISFSGNSINTSNGVVANIFGRVNPGKTIVISGAGTPANNTTYVVSTVTNNAGIANIVCYGSFTTEATGAQVTLIQRDGFVDERAPQGGSAAAKYVTRQINLNNPSKYLRIMFAANVPAGTAIDVYYRTLVQGSLTPLNQTNFVQATPVAPIVTTSNPSDYFDVAYEIDDLPSFTAAAVKIVFRSSNSSTIPTIRDLRVIACP